LNAIEPEMVLSGDDHDVCQVQHREGATVEVRVRAQTQLGMRDAHTASRLCIHLIHPFSLCTLLFLSLLRLTRCLLFFFFFFFLQTSQYTIGSFSWLQGVVYPSYALLTLHNDMESVSTASLSLCRLPPQLYTYMIYLILSIPTIVLLVAFPLRNVIQNPPR
jgi:hypothetical protein